MILIVYFFFKQKYEKLLNNLIFIINYFIDFINELFN